MKKIIMALAIVILFAGSVFAADRYRTDWSDDQKPNVVIEKGLRMLPERVSVSSYTVTAIITASHTNFDVGIKNPDTNSYSISISSDSAMTYQGTYTWTLAPGESISPDGKFSGGIYAISESGQAAQTIEKVRFVRP